MRLLQRLSSGEFELISFIDEQIPPYAILSHTWIEGQEVTYTELVAGTGKHKAGFNKLVFCSRQAADDGLYYFWVDTCCIDKSSSSELSTAINSMFQWYQRAAKCYVYLSDVSVLEEDVNAQALQITWVEAFRQSRWFTRGWTLQELLAPPHVEFFSKNGKRLGSRNSLEQDIHQVTSIPAGVLRGQSLTEYSIKERMRWAASRVTTLKEDKVYCLLGIFGVFLPLIYGEGEEYAIQRLEEEIIRRQKGQGAKNSYDPSVSLSLPFPRNERFVGREEHLLSLKQTLFSLGTHSRMTVYGLGGCGKSSLALEFAYRVLEDQVADQIFWVPAISRERFELAYREIATRLGIPGSTDDNADIIKLVKETLSAHRFGSWLMIIDNADDPAILSGPVNSGPGSAQLSDILPRSHRGAILFTTRSRKYARILTPDRVLELGDMSQAETRQLLAKRVTDQELLNDSIAVERLLSILAYLPLAIIQAAAFINSNGTSVTDYVSLLQSTGAELELFSEQFEDPSRYQEIDSTIAKTWHISFNQIRRQDPLAAQYLAFMACIDRIQIPQSLLPPGGSRVQQFKALGTLTGYAFITERQQGMQVVDGHKVFDMHRLVHMASAAWLHEHGEWASWAHIATNRLVELLPYGGYDRKEVWVTYLPHALRLAGCADVVEKTARASLLGRVGQCQASLGQYATAEASHRQALLLSKETVGPVHLDTLMSMSNLARVLDRQGKYEEAEKLHRQTLAQREKVLGYEHPDTLTSISNLALVLDNQGKYEEAEVTIRQTLARRQKVLGCEHPDTLVSMSNLAAVLDSQGKYEEAEMINRQTLSQYQEVLGLEHPDTLTSMNNLAAVLDRQGKYEEAEAMDRETLARREKLLGLEHPDTLTSMNNLALVLRRQGKYEMAEEMHNKELEFCRQVLGHRHPDTLTSMNNLAEVLGRQGKYKESEAMHSQALEGREKVLGQDHPNTLTSVSNLGTVLERQGKYKEAEAIHYRALEGKEKVLGQDHPNTLISVSQLGSVLLRQGKYEEAKEMHRRALEGREKVLGQEHPETLTSVENLALLFHRQQNFAAALVLYRRAHEGFLKVLGAHHPTTKACWNHYESAREQEAKYEM